MELPKFNKTLEDLNNLVEKWIFFLKNAEHFTEKPPILAENKVLNKALEISNLATVSVEELEEIQTRQMWLVDQETITRYAKEIAREEGIKEGIEQGVGQGVEKATKEMINRLIKRQLGEISPEIKKRIDQLSLDKIRILEEELFNFQNQDNLINWLDSH